MFSRLFQLILSIITATLVSISDASYCYQGDAPSSCTEYGLKIQPPFWIDSSNYRSASFDCQPYSGFEVKCEGDKPVMNISNHRYYVKEINQISTSIRLVDADIAGQECPQPRHNFSLQSIAFLQLRSYSKSIENVFYSSQVTIFYNCTVYPKIGWQQIPCLENSYHNNKTRRSYAFVPDEIPEGLHNNCEETVVIPTDLLSGNFTEALISGFQLRWSDPVDCGNCMDSGGQCSPNQTTGGIRCQCPGGMTLLDDTCPNKNGMSTKIKATIGVSIGVGGLLFIVLLLYRGIIYSLYNTILSWKNKTDSPTDVEAFLKKNDGSLSLQRYKYLDVKKMTNSFEETVGRGGYGIVYKGKLHDGCLVAVKVLNESKGNGDDFINEVAAIGRTNHVNVVSLLGFCAEGNKRALVYEFMSNGSLERFIYSNQQANTTSTPPLGWETLYHIALGVARGLGYLHRDCNIRILHLDIKPHNILLDQNFCPKISDFGLAKLCPTLASIVSIAGARGTMGYIAPEVCCRNFGGVSDKSDVYSYGMMVLEMIGGRKNIDATVVNISEIYFPHWIYNHLEQGIKVHESEECKNGVSRETFEDGNAKKMIIVALWCIQAHPNDRPSMRKVAEMLEGNVEELQMPPNPNMDPLSKYSSSP